MTIDEAIAHCEEVAEEQEKKAKVLNGDFYQSRRNASIECASEHRQLAEWLRKLKTFEEAKERIIEVSWEHTFTFSDESEPMTYKICALDTVLEILGGDEE